MIQHGGLCSSMVAVLVHMMAVDDDDGNYNFTYMPAETGTHSEGKDVPMENAGRGIG